MRYPNAAHAFIGELREVIEHGAPVTVREQETREIQARLVTIENPVERFITIPKRRNDVFHAVAETMWVVSGRDDVAFLERYLPRAPEFSDDGLVWRGAYGPRLRNWSGVDQVDEIRRLLLEEPESRRAVAVLFDPSRDFQPTRDVPCNNWLHFLRREGRVDLNVTIRSNDILWGFSGINTFEWSVLHEMMAHWLSLDVGQVTFFISSLHLYEDRRGQCERTLAAFAGRTGYEDGWGAASFLTPWERFAAVTADWFKLEEALFEGVDVAKEVASFPDPLLRSFLQAIAIKWAAERGAKELVLRQMVAEIGQIDVAFALREQMFRDSATVLARPGKGRPEEVSDAIEALHRTKDAAYGDSWKRRGEQTGILANIARKSDRIGNIMKGAPTGAEPLIDTAVDLFVYALKYESYLADRDQAVAKELFASVAGPYSDGPEGFARLIRSRPFTEESSDIATEAAASIDAFDRLEALVREGTPSWVEKAAGARRLSDAAGSLVMALLQRDPQNMDLIRASIK
jgi:thymidylate synthase